MRISPRAVQCLFLGAMALFLVRGPVRAIGNSSDFGCLFSAARAWMVGQDPYTFDALDRAWSEAGGEADQRPSVLNRPCLYPPSIFPVLSLLAALPWGLSRVALACLSTVSVIAIVRATSVLVQAKHRQRRELVWAVALAFAPVHTCLAVGQGSLIALALMMVSLVLAEKEHAISGGVLMAMSLAVKPQLTLAGLVWAAARGRKRFVVAAIVGIVAISALAVVRMPLGGEWVAHWREVVTAYSQNGNATDSSPLNPYSYQLINLQVGLLRLISSRTVANIIAAGLAGAAVIVAIWRSRSNPALSLAALTAASLVPVYHRFYDAVALLVTIIVVETQWPRMRVLLIPLAVFMIPGGVVLHAMAQRMGLAESPLWMATLDVHQVWALAVIVVILAWMLTVENADSPQSSKIAAS